MKTYICYTKFKLDPFSDGGSKRSVQIRELLKDNGIFYINDSFILPKNTSKLTLINWSIRAVHFIHKHYAKNRIKSLAHYYNLIKYYALRIPIILDKYKDQDVCFLWENTNDRDILYLMKATGHQVIALPHNLESLVNNQSTSNLASEVFNLKNCDTVFTISKEETWLLRLLGVNAFYLPYYPPIEVESLLLSIRRRRSRRPPNNRKKYALLGSATNDPTRAGMQAIIDYASTQTLAFNLIVAGYGTETLTKVGNPHISFLGTLSNEALEELLYIIDGVIIYQPPTTGALTRIPEMILAGIPIFLNFDAARNYFSINGLTLFSSYDELFSLLKLFDPITPELFHRDTIAEDSFISRLTQCR